MKETLLKIFGRQRAGPKQSTAGISAASKPAPPNPGRSGETVFSAEAMDPTLRFRSLTLPEADQSLVSIDPDVQPAFKIRLAKSTGFRREAGGLVGKRYTDRGYLVPAATQDPNLYSFLAYDDGQIVGTVSIRLDSKLGLSADGLYRAELDELRQGGCTVCEFTRLAVDVKTASKPVLAGLFHTAYLYASAVRGYMYAVIEVNPRHVAFYRRALGFEPIGPERMNARVEAPAVLLCVPFSTIQQGIAEYGGKVEQAAHERSLFPFAFSPEEEQGILQRLRELDVTRNPVSK